MRLDWDTLVYFFPKLLAKLPLTISIVLVATVFGLLLGLALALARLERVPVLRQASGVLVSFLRGTPIIVQMFLVYFGLPLVLQTVGVDIRDWDKIWFVYLTYSLNAAAFFSEILRSSIGAVPKAQWDAAAGCGLTRAQTYRRIVLPQSVAIALPATGMTITGLLQDTSLAFMLGIVDVIGQVKAMGSITGHLLEGYIVAAFFFVVLSLLLERLFHRAEKKVTLRQRTS
ncbi:MAG: amino acid ABC transporter permease [Oscillospiraceae bacterium]|jgi:L-cystine transport system permease protein|nr:amino acid ABC transporter permease [Oscillospiraceae bacterium]